jgi:predicted glycoside hydrolase/deacetylase ChbG (UPF0249 family)
MIRLIINADDFGSSIVFNEKILDLLEKEYIKSTTVLVNRVTESQQNQIKELIKLYQNKKISVGLHLEFDDAKPALPQIESQYQKFISIFGFKPTHLDVHKSHPDALEIMNKFAEKDNLPVRNLGVKSKTKQTTTYRLLAQKFDLNELIGFVGEMKENNSYEIVTHPGDFDPNSKSTLNKERKIEYDNICKLHEFLKSRKDIKLISYRQL